MKRRFRTSHSVIGLVLLVLALLLAACGPLPTNPPDPMDDARGDSPATTVAGMQNSPAPTATPVREPLRLVVLHTNDNWGETEPCG